MIDDTYSALNTLWLVPAAPLVSFLVLVLVGARMSRRVVAVIGAGAIGTAMVAAAAAAIAYYDNGATPLAVTLWTWMQAGTFAPKVTLYLDGLSLVMMGVVTGVGFLIHLYATGYMREEAGYHRFFAYMHLFVFSMLVLVLADDLLLLFLGWEGVGLCSYLLIGFFHDDPANGYAARKAFVVTRIGDTAFAIALFLLFREVGTLEIQAVLDGAVSLWPDGSTLCTVIALLLLGGAVGKSAQVPLQTWLPDAMAGPTPVSALIHAATMVTAGVYLIARMHDLYLLSPAAQLSVAMVGLVTLVIAATSALTQNDIKRVLAYSTMSQIGYMFLALGVGAWSAAIFHLVTHAFFKALLFLCAGSVILALHHQQDIRQMGGLWRRLPIPFAGMLVGGAALSALPLTSGFFSKDLILLSSWDHGAGGPWFWGAAAFASLLTGLYTARLVLVVFFGAAKTEPADHSTRPMSVALIVLTLLALGGGWLGLSPVASVLPDGGLAGEAGAHPAWLQWLTAAFPVAGLAIGVRLFTMTRAEPAKFLPGRADGRLHRFLTSGWGFDRVFDALVTWPFTRLARLNQNDAVDGLYTGIAALARGGHGLLARSQTGKLRWYAANMALGVMVVVLFMLGLW